MPKLKAGICMSLPCEDCGKVHDIPTDKLDDFNIYRKWDGVGSLATCRPCLLCSKCSKKAYKNRKVYVNYE